MSYTTLIALSFEVETLAVETHFDYVSELADFDVLTFELIAIAMVEQIERKCCYQRGGCTECQTAQCEQTIGVLRGYCHILLHVH